MSFLTRVRSLAAFVFLASDGRVRPAWRAFLFLPVFGALTAVVFLPLRFLVSAEQLAEDLVLRLLLNNAGLAPALLASYLLVRLADKRSFRTLGLWFYQGWGREVGAGLGFGFLLVAATVGPLVLAGQIEFEGLQGDAAVMLRGLAWYSVLLIPAAAIEEVVFRGYPFQRLLEAWGSFRAVFLPSVLFGLGHLGNPSATPLSTANTVLAGVLLSLAYLRTRGLWFPIALHFSWNFTMGFVLSLPVSGIVLPGQWLTVRTAEPVWLSGGSYGPEGSAVLTATALAATLWLARTRRLGVSPALAAYLPGGSEPAKEVQ